MLQSHREDEMDEIHFLSTQMQARHEEASEKETHLRNIRRKLLSLGLFRNINETTPEPSVRRKSLPKPKVKPKRKSSKISSINAFVRDNLGNSSLALLLRERPSQALILLYFSGDRKKVDDLLNKIEHEEDLNNRGIDISLTKNENDHPQIFYTKDEWKCVIDNVKLRFPNLSSKTKKTLKGINKRIQMSESLREDSPALQGMWSQASALPDNELTPDDIRWLYDLDEEQMMNNQSMIEETVSTADNDQFVMTLSQALNSSDGLRPHQYHSGEAIAEGTETEGDSEGEVVVQEVLEEEVLEKVSGGSSPEASKVSLRHQYHFQERQLEQETQTKQEYLNDFSEKETVEILSEEELLDVVPDSSSDIEILEVPGSLLEPIDRTPLTQKDKSATPFPEQSISAHQEEPSNFDPLASLVFAESLPQKDSFRGRSKNEEIFSSPTRPTLQVILSRAGTQTEPIDLEGDSPLPGQAARNINDGEEVFSSFMPSKNEEEEVITSSPVPLLRGAVFKTPSKWPNAIPKMSPLSSPIRLPFFTSIKQQRAVENDDLQENSSSSDEADYSTARPYINEETENVDKLRNDEGLLLPSKHLHASKKNPRRKVYKTSTVEVRGNFTFDASLLEDPKVQVRMVGPKVINLDSDEEVKDSEDDQDISIVEITRELDDTEQLIDAGKDGFKEPELQVPSSPDAGNGILRMLPSEDSFDTVYSFGTKVDSQAKESAGLKVSSDGDEPEEENETPEGNEAVLDQERDIHEKDKHSETTPGDVDFTNLTVPQLRKQLKEWGLKPVSGKLRMIQVLQNASKLMKHSQQSSQLASTRMFNGLTTIIRQNDYWFSRVASFEPILLEELQLWLAEQGMALEIFTLVKYCDKMGISTTARGA